MKKSIHAATAIALVTCALSGCVPLAIGAGATAGVAAAQEGGIRTAASDTAIRAQIADFWFKRDVEMFRKLNMTVKEGRVLITGSVPTADMRVEAVRLAWQAEGVRQVINEINVDQGTGITGYATDSWITSTLKSQLLLDADIQSINYTVETVNATVYLMGVAQDQAELSSVINYARNINNVKNVISYVRLRGETPNGLQPPTSGKPSQGLTPAYQMQNSGQQSGAQQSGYAGSGQPESVTASRPEAVTAEPLR